MPPQTDIQSDLIRVRHMIDAIEEILGFVQGKTRRDLDRDRMLVLAVLKDLEIMGEAARQVTPGFQQGHSDIPWAHIVSTRNRLAHGYFDVDLDIVWNTIQDDLPGLLTKLKKYAKKLKD